MQLDQFLLDILVCPQDKRKVNLADQQLIDEINNKIAQGSLFNNAKRSVNEKIEGGLLTSDGKRLYPIRNGIPIMLIDEAIPLV